MFFSLRSNCFFCVFLLASVVADADSFSYDVLRAQARELAQKPHAELSLELDDFWKNLSYDEHRDIRFQMDRGLWAGESRTFSIDFFHPGWTAKKMVDIYQVDDEKSQFLTFDRTMFDYGKQVVPADVPPPPDYAGWRARTHLNSKDYMDEFLVFLGASYFRAIPANAPYGLSARGLSINSGLPGVPEEFPDFQKFYLEKPSKGAKSLRAWALLGGDSVSGAYQFTITPGVETVMDVEAEITLRKPVQQLGLAPFSSMFWFGENTHPRPYDFRPEVHDSDGLLMQLESGNMHFRPLEHTAGQYRHCVFLLEKPRSWSLVQRDRSFLSYEDPEARYHERPSVTVEPQQGFDLGKLHLIELPTKDETEDNIVLCWEPMPALQVGTPYHFRYRLRWQNETDASGHFAVKATRLGHPVQLPNQVLIAVDFAKPLKPESKKSEMKWEDFEKLKPVVTINQTRAKLLHVGLKDVSMPNVDAIPAGLGRDDSLHMPQVLRAFFVIEPETDVLEMDLTCELQDASGKCVSERWLYLWRRTH